MFIVQVVDCDTKEVVKSFAPQETLRKAERLELGLSINLSDKFYTKIVDESGEEVLDGN